MPTLYICEKRDQASQVAEGIARVEGGTVSPGRTRTTVGDAVLVWLNGHAWDTANPGAYDPAWKSFRIQNLPMVPERWKLVADPKKSALVSELRRGLSECDTIVNCGDPGREGQLIVDEALVECGVDPHGPRVRRLWVQDMSDRGMDKAIGAIAPNSEKRTLYDAAVTRQRADWTYGMNMTVLYTALARASGADVLLSVGRVQTPTLRLVVDRDLEIENHRRVDHYGVDLVFEHPNGRFKAVWQMPAECPGTNPQGLLVDKSVAQAVVDRVRGKDGVLKDHRTTDKSAPPPLPYSLTSLQKEAGQKYDLTAQQVLDVAQRLYEAKITSYPRTDCPYLPDNIRADEAPTILAALGAVPDLGDVASGADPTLKSPAWNDAKLTDHYGIVPTVQVSAADVAGLSGVDRKVFDLIAKRFVAQFYPHHRWKATTATVGVGSDTFKATGKRDVDPGWRRVYGAESDDGEDGATGTLPEMAKGDGVRADTATVCAKKTSPPPRFTDPTLIEAMEAVHLFVSDRKVRERLKESSGIGTPATRANIIEKLIKKGYMTRRKEKRKQIVVSTPLGRSLVATLDKEVVDPGLTALWEENLEKVVRGEITGERYLEILIGDVRKKVERLKGRPITVAGVETIAGVGRECPKCGVGKLAARRTKKGAPFLACDAYDKEVEGSCDHKEWVDDPVDPLPGHGETCPHCRKGKTMTRAYRQGANKGKRYLSCDGYDANDEASCRYVRREGAPHYDPLPRHGETCPKCSKGVLHTKLYAKDGRVSRYVSCSRYRGSEKGSCDFVEWEPRAPVEPVEGHGETCPECGKGTLVTRQVTKDGPRKGQKFLSCDAYDPKTRKGCSHMIWPGDYDGPVQFAPMEGDGKACTACGKGVMRTRMIRKGEMAGKRMLACDNWKKGRKDNCDNKMYERLKEPAPGLKPARKPGRRVRT